MITDKELRCLLLVRSGQGLIVLEKHNKLGSLREHASLGRKDMSLWKLLLLHAIESASVFDYAQMAAALHRDLRPEPSAFSYRMRTMHGVAC